MTKISTNLTRRIPKIIVFVIMYNTVEAILARILSKTFCLQDCVNRIWTWWQNWKKWAGRQVWGKTGNNRILTKEHAEMKMFFRTVLFYQCCKTNKHLIFPALACKGLLLLNVPSRHWCRNSKKKKGTKCLAANTLTYFGVCQMWVFGGSGNLSPHNSV